MYATLYNPLDTFLPAAALAEEALLASTGCMPFLASKYSHLVPQFRRLETLSDGWDSYGAPIPNCDALSAARAVVATAHEMGVLPTALVPSAEGGVGIMFRRGGLYADIECFNDGDIVALIAVGDEMPHTWTIKPEDVPESLRTIRDFLGDAATSRIGA